MDIGGKMISSRKVSAEAPERSSAARAAHALFLGTLLMALASCAMHAPSQGEDVRDNIRDKMFDAYGGKERLAQIRSIAAEGTITALVRKDSGVYRRAWRRDNKLFVDVQYSQSRETRILNGTRVIRGVDGKMEDATGPGYQAVIYQYNELSMPFALLDDTFSVRDLGDEPLAGDVVRVLRCTDRSGNSIDLYVSEQTYRIVKTQGTFPVGDTKTTLSAVFGDFRFFEGVLVPFRIVNYAGDTMISETVIDDYLFNADLSETLFNPHPHGQEKSNE